MTRYLKLLSVAAFGFCGAVALVNYVVDPYAIYHFDKADADYLSRIDQFFHMRLSKPRNLLQLRPDSVVLGSSRSASIKPQHATWDGHRNYNFSVPGLTMYEMYRFIQHAQATGPLEKLMIGVDFELFMTPSPPARYGFAEHRFASLRGELETIPHQLQWVRDSATTLLSLPALSRSISALSDHVFVPRRYYRDGTWSQVSGNLLGRPGYVFISQAILEAHGKAAYSVGRNVEIVADILRFCHHHNIDTRLFVTPTHVFLVDMWQRLGYTAAWGDFHRHLVDINRRIGQEAGREPFPLWGFNNAKGIVDEAVALGRDNHSAWFQDGIHFRERLGSRIMQEIWGEQSTFGQRLDEQTTAPYLAEVDRLAAGFLAEHAAVSLDLKQQICGNPSMGKARQGDSARKTDSYCDRDGER